MGNQPWPQFQNGIRERSITLTFHHLSVINTNIMGGGGGDMIEDWAAVRSHLTCGPLSYSEILEELFVNELICTLIAPWHGAHDICWNRSQLVPIEFKSGPSCVKHTIANQFPDLVSRLHVQVRLMGNFGLNGSLPWLQNTDGAICFICKEDILKVWRIFFLDCSYFRNNFESLWKKLKIKIARSNPIDGAYICNFIKNLDGNNRVLLFSGELVLPFDNEYPD